MEINCNEFPCHKDMTNEDFCSMCYCPLYMTECDGKYELLRDGMKDCSNCMLPHTEEGQEMIIESIKNFI